MPSPEGKAAVCAPREARLYMPLGQPAAEGHQGVRSPGGRPPRGEEKGYGVVWGYHSLDSGKREGARPTMVRRKFKEGTCPALVQVTENAGKCAPSCGCPTALCLGQVSLSRSSYKTQQWKYSHFVGYGLA